MRTRRRWSRPLGLTLTLALPLGLLAAGPGAQAVPVDSGDSGGSAGAPAVEPAAVDVDDGAYDGYVFPYFAGADDSRGEAIHLAVSDADDPMSWTTLNAGEPVIESEQGTGGLRDPFLLRSPDGSTFYLLATDLQMSDGGSFAEAQETGSRSIMIWESTDLVNWSDQRSVELAPPEAGNLWAPEAHWDAEQETYVVYWASALYPEDVAEEDRSISDSYQRMMYATTDDFVEFSEPQVWIDEKRGEGLGMIDSTIAEVDGRYHRLTKDESDMTVRQETSEELTLTQGVVDGDGWEMVAEQVGVGEDNPWGGTFTSGEGPTMFPSLTDDGWYLMIDQPSYHGGEGYMLFETADIGSGDWTSVPEAELPSSPRHGTVVPITDERRRQLVEAYPPAPAEQHSLSIDAGETTAEISDTMYGGFYEDINYAADGGVYAELVRNRSFEFAPTDHESFTGMTAWETLGDGSIGVESEREEWLNDANRAYLRIDASGSGDGVRNTSYNGGVALEEGASYDFSVHARSDVAQELTVRLEDEAGEAVHAETTVAVDGSDEWAEHTAELTSSTTTDSARLVVAAGADSTLRLDMVSLFPQDTWEGPVNGPSVLREDLAQKVADLEPGFLRFPGGCVTNVGTFDSYEESDGEDRRRTYQWKETVGPIEERPTNWNFWGYNQSYGLGYYEYMTWAEDLHAEPVPVVSVGANGCGSDIPEMTDPEQVETWVQDTLDLIEFANGSADSDWGSVRAEMGHPEPFDLEYIGLGNEENTHTFEENFPAFRDAIEAEHPEITIISNSGPDDSGARFDELWEFNREQGVDMVDEHYYNAPGWFLANDERYDSYDRQGPDVFVGEYASQGNTFGNALAEAAYMTGLERNADVVRMASYAPMFANEDHVQWSPDMMWFDNDESWGSANYYTQKMFMTNVGDEVVASEHTGPAAEPDVLDGGIFLSTWLTQAAYDDVSVTANDTGETLYSETFDDGSDWSPQAGDWSVVDGEYVQSDAAAEDARSLMPDAYGKDWSNYTLELTARKESGDEGFLVGFAANGGEDFYWWNIGGWGNTRSVLEHADGGRQGEVAAVEDFSLEEGRDYQVKVVVEGRSVELYLDGELHLSYTEPTQKSLYQVVTRDADTGELIVKLVNPGAADAATEIAVEGMDVAEEIAVTELSAAPGAVNTKEDPTAVAPEHRAVDGGGDTVEHTVPAHSVTFLRLAPAGEETGDAAAGLEAKVQPKVIQQGRDTTSVKVSAGSGRQRPTGQVTVVVAETEVSGTLEKGRVRLQLPTDGLAAGEHVVEVSYAGDADYASSAAEAVLTVR